MHIFNLNQKIKNGIKQLFLFIGKFSFWHCLRHSYDIYQYKYLINIIINYTYHLRSIIYVCQFRINIGHLNFKYYC